MDDDKSENETMISEVRRMCERGIEGIGDRKEKERGFFTSELKIFPRSKKIPR